MMTGLERIGLVATGEGGWRIPIPAHANLAADTVGRHATGARADHPALVFE